MSAPLSAPSGAPDLAPLAASTAGLFATMASLDSGAVTSPSALPGWSIGHVLTHLARNADGFVRMLEGAAGGVVLDQYAGGATQREADIEAGAGRDLEAVAEDVRASAGRLRAAAEAMPGDAWSNPVRTLAGEYPARNIPPRRRREVEIHHVDLGLTYRAMDWPADMVTAELALAIDGVEGRLPLGTAVRLVATDTNQAWEVGGGPASLAVSGVSAWLLAWLLGRAVPPGALHAPAGLPPLRSWL